MKASHHVKTILSTLWRRKLVKSGVALFLVFEFLVFVKFDKSTLLFNRNRTTDAQQNSTDLNMIIPNDGSSKALKKSGYLNLHLWSNICAKDLNILCNFPLFPQAPDNRLLLNKAIITGNVTDAEGIRLFGYIIPDESGSYVFMVKFCSAEVWLSHNEDWRDARKILGAGKFSQNKVFQISATIVLMAGKKYFIDVVASCFHKINKLQLLWKTPTSSGFEIINATFLSHYMDDNGSNYFNFYNEKLPDSPVCAPRRNKTTYFQVHREISYLSHEEVKNILPYCEYKPSYIANQRIGMYNAVINHVVHTFIYPFPEHANLKDQKYWIYPLGEKEAMEVVHIFMESLQRKIPR